MYKIVAFIKFMLIICNLAMRLRDLGEEGAEKPKTSPGSFPKMKDFD